MKDKIFIKKVGDILVSCDKGNTSDEKGITKLLKLYCKYINDGIKKVN